MEKSRKVYVVLVGEQDTKKKFVQVCRGQSTHEVVFVSKDRARVYQPGVAIRVSDCIRSAVQSPNPVPRVWATAQAQYEDGTPVEGEPQISCYVAPTKPVAPSLPDVPEVAYLDSIVDPRTGQEIEPGRWVSVPEMKKLPRGYGWAYAWVSDAGEPVSGMFSAETPKDLFDSVFGQPVKDPKFYTLERIYREHLPPADPAKVEAHRVKVAEVDRYRAEREAKLRRLPTESEIAAVEINGQVLDKVTTLDELGRIFGQVPAAVFRDRMLSEPAFRIAYERYERIMRIVQAKQQQEEADAAKLQAARDAQQRLEARERGEVAER